MAGRGIQGGQADERTSGPRRVVALACLLALLALLPLSAADVPIRIHGWSAVSPGVLTAAARRELATYQLHRTPAALADAAFAMQAALNEQGFAHAQVTFAAPAAAPAMATNSVDFTVLEGPRCRLGHLTIEGCSALSAHRLQRLYAPTGVGFLDLGSPPFRRREVDACADAIERLYLHEGYQRVTVTRPKLHWRAGRRVVDVTITLSEGPRYTVAATTVAGLVDAAQRSAAEAIAVTLIGTAWRREDTAEAAARIRSGLMDQGRWAAVVTSTTAVDDATATVHLDFTVVPGPVYRLRAVRVQGSDRTRPRFITARFPLTVGAPIARNEVDAGVRTLLRTGVFRGIDATPVLVDGDAATTTDDDTRTADLDVRVRETTSRQFDLEVGYGSYEQLRGGVRLIDRNLLGWGRSLELHPTISQKSEGVELRLRDRTSLGEHNTIELSVSYQRRQEPTFDRTTFAPTISTLHQFDGAWQAWSTELGYTFEQSRAANVQGEISAAERDGFVSNARVFTRVRRDTRDSVVLPTMGTAMDAGIAYSAPALGSDLDFIEWRAGASAYWSPDALRGRMVVAADSAFTTRQILNGDPSLPVASRLFLGGENSVRSFRQDQLGPKDAEGIPVGGLTSANATLEARWQAAGALWLAAFYDVGVVDPKSWTIRARSDAGEGLGQGYGAGVRYQLPVGPVRFDLAYNPDVAVNSSGAWVSHLAVGFSF